MLLKSSAISSKFQTLFSSKSDAWSTPQWFFDALDAEFGFEVDVCASPQHAKCPVYYTPEVDGLKQEWYGTVFCNPPYGRQIGAWVRKAFESSRRGTTVVCLLPARTDTKWWHQYVMRAAEIRFLRGRLRFGDAKSGAPFPSAVVISRVPRPKIVSCVLHQPETMSSETLVATESVQFLTESRTTKRGGTES
jgi:phage N-6-adenine-methyltransferase